MKKLTTIAMLGLFAFCFIGSLYADEQEKIKIAAIDEYQLKIKLNIPKIYKNTQSLGYRKYQKQNIVATMQFMYGYDGSLVDVYFYGMVNQTHKMSNGKHVTYNAQIVDDFIFPIFNAIGNNKTKKFKVASICFNLAADPSYNIGQFDEDNSLFVTLAGKGSFASKSKKLKKASGYASGVLGCGCAAYGHTSPTRKIGRHGPTSIVDDVAAVFGSWSISLKHEEMVPKTNFIIYK